MSMNGLLTEHQQAALSACTRAVLGELAPGMQSCAPDPPFRDRYQLSTLIYSAFLVSEALSAVLAAVHSACASFAERWNDRNTSSLIGRLPFELVAACLYWADLPTRIRASTVSRAWRKLALSERRLWADFCCTAFTSYGDQLLTFGILKTMLRRSDPLPFRLHLPHGAYGPYGDYECSIADAVVPDMHRVQEYDGRYFEFSPLNKKNDAPLALKSFSFLNRRNIPSTRGDSFTVTAEVDGRRLPNLRRLVCPTLIFREGGTPYNRLQELVCVLPADDRSKYLFRCCPNLVIAEFLGVRNAAVLPFPPCPSTLQHIIIHGDPDREEDPDGVNFAPLLAWSGHMVPQLTLFGAESLYNATTYFIAQYGTPISLRVSPCSPNITLSTADGSQRCEISICAFWAAPGRLSYRLLEPVSGLVAHISVCAEHLCAFFNAQFDMPRLVSLELSMHGAVDNTPQTCACIRAPALRDLTLDIDGYDNGIRARLSVLDELMGNLRALVVYDADLLDTLTVRCSAAFARDILCADLARFARRFIGPEC